jgi:cytochrome c biogenesis protein ResB
MPLVLKLLSASLKLISSGKLALVIVIILMLFAFAGATLPQKDRVNPDDIAQWQNDHAMLTAVLKPIGMFHVFTSWPFMATLMVLGVNTLTCTILRFIKDGGVACLKGPDAMEKGGFLLLHISLIILMAGGFISTAKKMNGYIVLTEGQTFVENHESYLRIAEGPLRKKAHKDFALKLNNIKTEYQKGFYQTDVTSTVEVFEQNKKIKEATVRVNHPFSYRSLAFTHQDIGFSPRFEIKDKKTGRILFYSFVTLKTYDNEKGKEYRDFLPLGFLKNRTIITVYPDHMKKDGKVVKISDEPDNPLARIEVENEDGIIISEDYLTPGDQVTIGDTVFKFSDLRRWVSFQVIEDPGYLTVCVSLWMGLAALLLRYIPDLKKWSVSSEIS